MSVILFIAIFFLRIWRPPRSTRTDTLFPYTTLFRSERAKAALDGSTAASDLPNVPASITVPRIDTTTVTTAKPVPAPDGVHVQMIPAEEVAADADYASLAEAVAAQAMPDEADPQLNCLAGAIYFESKGEPLSGQLAVANVIKIGRAHV